MTVSTRTSGDSEPSPRCSRQYALQWGRRWTLCLQRVVGKSVVGYMYPTQRQLGYLQAVKKSGNCERIVVEVRIE
jgi:hypothetical protein